MPALVLSMRKPLLPPSSRASVALIETASLKVNVTMNKASPNGQCPLSLAAAASLIACDKVSLVLKFEFISLSLLLRQLPLTSFEEEVAFAW